ncbi:hypothetical protein ABBQ32_004926 [Trebouxia sp. C0010 RCD-2024]
MLAGTRSRDTILFFKTVTVLEITAGLMLRFLYQRASVPFNTTRDHVLQKQWASDTPCCVQHTMLPFLNASNQWCLLASWTNSGIHRDYSQVSQTRGSD